MNPTTTSSNTVAPSSGYSTYTTKQRSTQKTAESATITNGTPPLAAAILPTTLLPAGLQQPSVKNNTTTKPHTSQPIGGVLVDATAEPKLIGTYPLVDGTDIQHYLLANGHQVLLHQTKSPIVTLRTHVNVGSDVENKVFKETTLYPETPFNSGIAHFDEHCHFLTTEHYPQKNAWVQQVEALGVSENASTSEEEVQHELHFNREDLGNVLQLHAEQVLRVTYHDAEITQEKKNVINECSERMNSGMAELYNHGQELLYDRPSFQTLGNRSDILRTTAKDLQRFKQTFYIPTNMITTISGDVTPQEVLPYLNKTFGAVPVSPLQQENKAHLTLALKPHEVREFTFTSPHFISSGAIYLGFKGPDKRNIKDRMAVEVLTNLLANTALSPMQRAIVDEGQLANSIDCGASAYKQSGDISFLMSSRPSKEHEAVKKLFEVLATVEKTGFSEKELQEVKSTLSHDYREALQHGSIVSRCMGSEQLTQSLPFFTEYTKYLNGVPKNSPEYAKYGDGVTVAELQRVAKQYLTRDSYALVYALPGTMHQESEKTSSLQNEALPVFHPEGTTLKPVNLEGKTFKPLIKSAVESNPSGMQSKQRTGKTISKPLVNTSQQGTPTPAIFSNLPPITKYHTLAEQQWLDALASLPPTDTKPYIRKIDLSTQVPKDLGNITPKALANGVQGYFQQAENRATSTLELIFPFSTNDGHDIYLVGPLLTDCSLMSKEHQQALAAEGIELFVQGGTEKFSVGIKGPKGSEARLLTELLTTVQHPVIDRKEYEANKATTIENLLALGNKSQFRLGELMEIASTGLQHPYSHGLNQEIRDLKKATPEGTLRHLNHALKHPSQFNVVMVSSLPVDEQVALLNKSIAQTGWMEDTQVPQYPIKEIPAVKPLVLATPLLVSNNAAERVSMQQKWLAPLPGSPDEPAFTVLNHMLSGMTGVFFKVMRTEKGLVYSTSTGTERNPKSAYFTVSADIDFDKLPQAMEGYQEALTQLTSKKPTEVEVERAKRDLLQSIRSARETSTGLEALNSLELKRGLSPLQVDEQLNRYTNVTPTDILRVAQRYLGSTAWTIQGFTAPESVLKQYFPEQPMKPSKKWTLDAVLKESVPDTLPENLIV
jgi:zinc protease